MDSDIGTIRWLQDYDVYSRLARLDTTSGAYETFHRGEEITKSVYKTNGFFKLVDKKMISLFSFKNQLCFQNENKIVVVSGKYSANYELDDDIETFSLMKDGNLESCVSQKKEIGQEFDSDPTPFIFEDSFNFLLFLANVINKAKNSSDFIEVNA